MKINIFLEENGGGGVCLKSMLYFEMKIMIYYRCFVPFFIKVCDQK